MTWRRDTKQLWQFCNLQNQLVFGRQQQNSFQIVCAIWVHLFCPISFLSLITWPYIRGHGKTQATQSLVRRRVQSKTNTFGNDKSETGFITFLCGVDSDACAACSFQCVGSIAADACHCMRLVRRELLLSAAFQMNCVHWSTVSSVLWGSTSFWAQQLKVLQRIPRKVFISSRSWFAETLTIKEANRTM